MRKLTKYAMLPLLAVTATLAPVSAPADQRSTLLCAQALQYFGDPPDRRAQHFREAWFMLSSFLNGMAHSVGIMHPEAKGEFNTVRARWKDECQSRPNAVADDILFGFIED